MILVGYFQRKSTECFDKDIETEGYGFTRFSRLSVYAQPNEYSSDKVIGFGNRNGIRQFGSK